MKEQKDKEQKRLGFFRVKDLPDTSLEPFWKNIIVDTSVKKQLLNHMLLTPKLDTDIKLDCAINGLLLLYGPPGTGKTSLAIGCANEVAARSMAKTDRRTKLMQLNVARLFSEYLGRSVKAVAESFEGVRLVARHNLAIVLLDEIESIGVERATLGAGDPSDVARAVVAFLTEIDELRFCKNFAITGTSNLQKSIDRALWDRSDMRIYVGRPDADHAGKILEASLARFGRLGVTTEEGLVETFVSAFYNDDSVTPFSSRDLCRLPLVAVCMKGHKNLASNEVLQAAESLLMGNRKEKDYGNVKEEVVRGT